MQEWQETDWIESAGVVLGSVVLLVVLVGPVLWALLGDIHAVERATAKIDFMRDWLKSEFARPN